MQHAFNANPNHPVVDHVVRFTPNSGDQILTLNFGDLSAPSIGPEWLEDSRHRIGI